MRAKILALLLLVPLLSACDQVRELLDLPIPDKVPTMAEADGMAVGSACRHAGRSLEDCYIINPDAPKAAVFAGWREMNDYMMQNNMEIVPSLIPPPILSAPSAPIETADSGKADEPPPVEEGRASRRPRPIQ